jgi:choline dehydrogenase-like flavoprotein
MIFSDGDTISDNVDVCIVGAGPVGLALALKLEALGRTVTVLERGSGEELNPDESGSIEFQNGHHARSQLVSRPGIGGTSALWGGRCVPFDDLDFERREHVDHSGWPIPHDEVRQYYPEALDFLTCNTADVPIAELGSDDRMVRENALERWSRHPALGPYYAERLEKSRRINILTAASVTEILLDENADRAKGVKVRHRGRDIEVAGKIFVLAGGGLENARLLLSLRRAHPGRAKSFEASLGGFYQGHLTGYVAILNFFDPKAAVSLSFKSDVDGYSYRQRLQISPAIQAEKKLLNTVFWIDALSIADPRIDLARCRFAICSLPLHVFIGWFPKVWHLPRAGCAI